VQKKSKNVAHPRDGIKGKSSRIHGAFGIRHPQLVCYSSDRIVTPLEIASYLWLWQPKQSSKFGLHTSKDFSGRFLKKPRFTLAPIDVPDRI